MLTTLRCVGFVAAAWLLACCSNPGCLRHSQCGKGLECRDGMCRRPLPSEGAAAGDAGGSHMPFADAGWTPLTPAAGSGEAPLSDASM